MRRFPFDVTYDAPTQLLGPADADPIGRRGFIGSGLVTAAVVIIGGPLVLAPKACGGSTSSLVKWAGMFIGALKDVSPILDSMGAGSITALVARAIPIAEKLKKAFEDNDQVSALEFFDNLTNPQTGIVVQIAEMVGGLTDARKPIVLGLLAIGQVALRLIAANIAQEAPASAVATAKKSAPKQALSAERAAKANALEAAFAATKF